ncbi:MAG: tRNA pseudouridine(55) synthase TruB [Nocardioidaceae bacterium]
MTGHGLLIVDKPARLTSHDVVARARRITGTRKVGHAGTLDPMATGVLVLGVGRATRLLGHITLTDKAYDATVRLGAATTTDDAEGEVVATVPATALTQESVEAAFAAQVGDIEQVPSSVSAIKVGGKRAYARVRSGEQVELRARPVTIGSITVGPLRRVGDLADVDISVTCGSGTYVRAIARDAGAALGVGGHLTMLRRTRVGPFTLADASLDLDAGSYALTPMGIVGERLFPHLRVTDAQAKAISYGQKLDLELPAAGPVAMLAPDGDLLALYEQRGPAAAPVAVFR